MDQKPPGTFWVYRLALAFPGDPVVAFRCTAALFSAASAAALFFLARRLLPRPGAALAAALLAWTSADPRIQGPIANTELYMLTPVILANLFFLRVAGAPRPRPLPSLLVGVLVGAGCAFKQVAAVNAPFFLLAWPLLRYDAGPMRERIGGLAVFAGWAALGGLLVWLPILGWFLARGGLPALLDSILVHNLAYASAIPLDLRLQALSSNPAQIPVSQGLVWMLAAAGLVPLARSGKRHTLMYVGGWALFSAVGVSASGYYFAHYFQQLLPPVALAAAAAVVRIHGLPLLGRVPGRLRAVLLGAVALGQPVGASVPFWFLEPGEVMRRIYPATAFEAMPALADEIAAVTSPGDSVFVFGAEPELLFYAQRRSASRYIHLFPLYGAYADALEEQQKTVRELEAARPAAVVSVPTSLFFTPGAPATLAEWLEVELEANYYLHAMMTSDETSRGRLRRVPEAGLQLGEKEGIWALLYVRRPDAPR